MQMIVGNPSLIENTSFILDSTEQDNFHFTNSTDELRNRYLSGEWKVILQLIAVLQYGKLAKYVTDKAIDQCEHLQNLRVAIFDYKLRIDALEYGTKKHSGLLEIGCNYLVRYFYLITFADYLLEIYLVSSEKPLSFTDWLKDRREIINIIRYQSLD